MKGVKKLVAGIVAAATMASVGAVAYAHDYDFDLQTYDHGDEAYTEEAAYKTDTYNYAAIYCLDGYLSQETFAYFSVFNSSKTTMLTNEVKATDCNNSRNTATYKSIPSRTEKIYLRSRTGYYGTRVKGYWIP